MSARRLGWICVVVAFFVASAATGKVPSSVDDIHFEEDTFRIQGYSLDLLDVDEDVWVGDAETGEEVEWTHALECETENRCDDGRKVPGCIQQKCTLTVKLSDPDPGQRIRLLVNVQSKRTILGELGKNDGSEKESKPFPDRFEGAPERVVTVPEDVNDSQGESDGSANGEEEGGEGEE